jgi:methylmalonyl-CoA/ethylmalonyl-CoA epimerase
MATPVLNQAEPHHFCVSVGNRDEAIAWWRDIFGFECEFTFEIAHIGAKGAFVRKGPMRIEIFEIAGSAATPPERHRPNTDLQTQGGKHFCFAVDDVQAALEAVFAADVKIAGVMRARSDGMRQEDDPRMAEGRPPASAFFINDPWGTLIEILNRADFPA